MVVRRLRRQISLGKQFHLRVQTSLQVDLADFHDDHRARSILFNRFADFVPVLRAKTRSSISSAQTLLSRRHRSHLVSSSQTHLVFASVHVAQAFLRGGIPISEAVAEDRQFCVWGAERRD